MRTILFRGAAWEDAFLDRVQEVQANGTFKHIRIALFASRTLDHEMEKNTRSVIPYFTSTFLIMIIFSVGNDCRHRISERAFLYYVSVAVTCMMTDWVRSKPWLGLLGNLSAGMATVSAFGACMYFGVDFIGINLAAPFLMIGIVFLDCFLFNNDI